jgi:hypothetical protein
MDVSDTPGDTTTHIVILSLGEKVAGPIQPLATTDAAVAEVSAELVLDD